MNRFFWSVFGFSAVLFLNLSLAQANDARLQVIHNSADPAAAMVDVYVNGSLALDDFAFRAATPFLTLPAEVELNIGIAPSTSNGVQDTLKNFKVILGSNKTYVAVANGVLDPSQFAANPDAKSIAFTLFSRDRIREQGRSSFMTDFVVLHGATDAPTVDVLVKNPAHPGSVSAESEIKDIESDDNTDSFWFRKRLVNNLTYGEFTNYRRLFAKPYILQVTPGNDNSTIVASFNADLSGLGGGAAVVFASGFLNPSANQGGAAFGLFAALPNGTVVEFPMVMPEARLQIIHNAADPAAAMVDIYVNGGLLLDDFAFRAATPFVTVPANVVLNVGVAPGNSSSAADTLKNFPVMLAAGETYVAIANGVLDPNQFAANPDGREIGFTIFAKDMIRESGMYPNKVDFIVEHGSTDAPTVDVIARGVGVIVDDAAYGDITSYLSVPEMSYILDITPGNDNSTIVASFNADLSGLGGGAAVVFASGFLNPSANQGGAAFGLFAALPNGTVVEFPMVMPEARLQIIHNAADPAAAMVDIYVNGGLLLDDFAFRAATPFVTVPANVVLNVGVAPGNSSSAADTLKNFPVMLAAGETYVAIANGVLDPNQFAANPDGREIGFTIFAKEGAREQSISNNRVDFFAVHGATDAPTVNIYGLGIILKNVAYGDISDYFSVPAWKNWLVVTTSYPNFNVVGIYKADLSSLDGQSMVVFASGFLSPSANQNGESFGIFAALVDGTVVELPKIFGTEAQEALAKVDGIDLNQIAGLEEAQIVTSYNLMQNYPNPFNPTTRISFQLPTRELVNLKVFDITGREVAVLVNDVKEAGEYSIEFNAASLPSGMYFYRIDAGSFNQIRKMMLVK